MYCSNKNTSRKSFYRNLYHETFQCRALKLKLWKNVNSKRFSKNYSALSHIICGYFAKSLTLRHFVFANPGKNFSASGISRCHYINFAIATIFRDKYVQTCHFVSKFINDIYSTLSPDKYCM